MLESGDYIDIRFQDEARYKKPVGIYWLQAGVVKPPRARLRAGALTTIWLYRMPSLVGAIGAVLLTYWAALAFVSRRAAVLAGLMMASCDPARRRARLAKTDAMLLLTVLAAMGAMARAYLGERAAQPGLGVDAAGGVLDGARRRCAAEGAADPDVRWADGVALIVVDRSARWLRAFSPLQGLSGSRCWCCPGSLPSLAAAAIRSSPNRSGRTCSQGFRRQEAMARRPDLFRLFWLTFWPGATLAGMAAPAVWARAARRARIPAGMACAVLDRVGAGIDQAAALCAAALSRRSRS